MCSQSGDQMVALRTTNVVQFSGKANLFTAGSLFSFIGVFVFVSGNDRPYELSGRVYRESVQCTWLLCFSLFSPTCSCLDSSVQSGSCAARMRAQCFVRLFLVYQVHLGEMEAFGSLPRASLPC